jgi:hypothetical protein
VSVTVRSAFLEPIANCPTFISLRPTDAATLLCSCQPLVAEDTTGADGVMTTTFGQLGGRGSLDVVVDVFFGGLYEVARTTVEFTSSDLDASCDPSDAVGVVDLGIWAGGLPPSYLQSSDYDCDGVVDIVDLGIWASGLGVGCEDPPSP